MILLVAHALAADLVVQYDFESNDGGLVSDGDLGQWRWGVITAGPGSGYDGTRAWGTNIASATYLNDAVDTLEIPIPDLSTHSRPVLRFMQWFALGAGDSGTVEVNDGNGWTAAAPVYGYLAGDAWTGSSGGWVEAVVRLDGYGDGPRVRLVFTADDGGVGAGWFVDNVGIYDGDVAAPLVSAVTALGDTTDVRGPYVIEADVVDDTEVASVVVEWSTPDGATGTASMGEVSDGHWLGAIPGQAPDTVVSYSLVASDGVNSTRSPLDVYSFRVYLPAPATVEAPADRVIGEEALLRWLPPTESADLVSYRIERADGLTMDASASDPDEDGWIDTMVPVTGADDRFTVRGVFDIDGTVWEGDASEEVTVDAAVPALLSLSPDGAYAGDVLRLTLTGRYLTFVQDEVALDLGEGVTVESIDVRDVDVARATLLVDRTATPGPRTLTLTTPVTTITAEDGFTISAAADRPHLLAAEPDHIRQGESGTLTLTWQGELGDDLSVDLGEGVVINDVAKQDGTIVVDYTVAYTAPIGDHAIEVDDGTRLVDGASVEVKDVLRTVQSCGLGLSPSWFAVGAAVAGLRRRRR